MRARFHTTLLAVLLVAGACGGGSGERPNIVLLVSDDQDYEHLGFLFERWTHMPNVDGLAERGVVFANGQAQPRCRPSLAVLLSGRWPHQSGVYYNDGPRQLAPEDSLPNLLRAAGYATFAGGKFWEGDAAAMGFDAPEEPTRSFVRAGQDELFAFIEAHAGRRPLFVWWAPAMPHTPHDAPERYRERIEPDTIPIPDWFDQDQGVYRALERDGLAMETWLDDGVGELFGALEQAGILEQTLFVFLIDNGWSNGLLSKGSPYEKGVGTPIVFTWPGRIQPRRRDELVASVDIFPTLLDYAGVEVPDRAAGHSLRPLLAGGSAPRRATLCGAVYPRTAAAAGRPAEDVFALHARTERWKYVRYVRDVPESTWLITRAIPLGRLARSRGEEELFDLESDPYELENLAHVPGHGLQLEELRSAALDWWRSTGGGDLALD